MRAPTYQATLRAFQSRSSPMYGSLGGPTSSSYMRSDGRHGYVIEKDNTVIEWSQQQRLSTAGPRVLWLLFIRI